MIQRVLWGSSVRHLIQLENMRLQYNSHYYHPLVRRSAISCECLLYCKPSKDVHNTNHIPCIDMNVNESLAVLYRDIASTSLVVRPMGVANFQAVK